MGEFMFGYLVADGHMLNEEQQRLYRAFYCGLCRSLRQDHGFISRGLLRFDMAFLAIFLTSVYGQATEVWEKCFLHPVRPHMCMVNQMVTYAADMNMLLCSYHFLDDWKDDKNPVAFCLYKGFSGKAAAIEKKYPRQCGVMRQAMDLLDNYERHNELNPDLPAACFGRVMGEIFTPQEDSFSPALRRFGHALGEFVYIMDACMDLKADLKRGRYNPLASCRLPFKKLLDVLMAECVDAYRALDLKQYSDLIENVLFSGVWLQYVHYQKG